MLKTATHLVLTFLNPLHSQSTLSAKLERKALQIYVLAAYHRSQCSPHPPTPPLSLAETGEETLSVQADQVISVAG